MILRFALLASAIAHASAQKADKTSSPISAKSIKGMSLAKADKGGDGGGYGNIMLQDETGSAYDAVLVGDGTPGYVGVGAGAKSQKGTASAKANKSPGAKSGKSDAKSGEYWLSPFNCPGDCLTAQHYALSEHLLEDAVATCDASDEYQAWKVHEQGEFVKFESADQYDANMCLSVVPTEPLDIGIVGGSIAGIVGAGIYSQWTWASLYGAGSPTDAADLCSGKLGLVNCTEATTGWYFTGGQFLSAYCWTIGHSVALTVDKNCTELSVSSEADAMESGSSQTFMVLDQDFIQTITDFV